MTGKLIIFSILFMGSLALLPMVAFLGIDPLPGDLTFNIANRHVFLPFTQAFIASVVLALLYFWAKK
ncbi:MAG TPA: DUF2905 family protein [Rhizomicrobium sp.]|nr:DUF2905 family protein [Rhizomicrobium sp.]